MQIGIDEVGRGAWAGPLTVGVASGDSVAAGQLLQRRGGDGYYDSKALSPAKRAHYLDSLIAVRICFGVGCASAKEVDTLGLTGALRTASHRALVRLTAEYGIQPRQALLLLDGTTNYLGRSGVRTIVGGDRLHPLIAAASIAAKLARDQVMIDLDDELPYWDLAASKGYGSKRHQYGLVWQGPSVEHRQSFAPVRAIIEPPDARFFSR